MDLKEQRMLAAFVFEGIHRHGVSLENAVDQSLAVAEMLILRSTAREKERVLAEQQRKAQEAELERQRRELLGALEPEGSSSLATASPFAS